MKRFEGFGQMALANVCIAVGCGDVRMAEHFLDDAQIGSIF